MPHSLSSGEAKAKYRAGDLDGVVRCMTADQQATWRRALIQQALWHLNAIMTSPVEQRVLGLAQRWAQRPSDETVDELINLVFASGIVRPLTLPHWQPQSRLQQVRLSMATSPGAEKIRYLLQALVADAHDEAASAVTTLAATTVPFRGDAGAVTEAVNAMVAVARRWQLDAAWAVLYERPLPPFPALTHDAEGDYRAGRLGALLARLSDDQQRRCRIALMSLLLSRIPPGPYRPMKEAVRQQWQACLDAARRWLEEPGARHAGALRQAVVLLEQMAPEPPPQGPAALRLLLDLSAFAHDELARTALAVARALDQTVAGDLGETAAIAALELSYLESADLDDEMFDEDADEADRPAPHPGPTRKEAEWWELEAAWAILNGQPLPPLPGTGS
jgi:hypothetical protein